MRRPWSIVFAALFALGVSACDCVDTPGNAYTCTCAKRCQGVDSTYTGSSSCAESASEVTSAVTNACVNSCSPEATCSCSCSPGAECTIEATCR